MKRKKEIAGLVVAEVLGKAMAKLPPVQRSIDKIVRRNSVRRDSRFIH